MTITSTEFQQRVGYYLELAEKGEVVNIKKLKPLKSSFILKKEGKQNKKIENSNDLIKKLEKFMFKGTGETGLELQKRVRD